MTNLLPIGIIGTILLLSGFVSGTPILLALRSGSFAYQMGAWMIGLPLFIFTFVFTAGLISFPAHKSITKGKFPRDIKHPVYFWRRFYGLSWTTVYYAKPIYAIALTIPIFKTLMLRLFGYKSSTDFTVYPDTWIRDLPVLTVGKGAYLSNRATIGTNICLMDGSIFVDEIKMDEKALIGHLAVIGPGANIGREVELGVGSTIGIKTRLHPNVKVGINTTLLHGVVVDSGSQIGNSAYVGLRAHIYSGISIPPGAVIPAGSTIKNQAEIDEIVGSEKSKLKEHREKISLSLMRKNGP